MQTMQDDPRETALRLAALAGVPLSPERVEAVAAVLRIVQAGAAGLAAIDYGDFEPAGAFRPPRPVSQ
jgi:hypothetical protein